MTLVGLVWVGLGVVHGRSFWLPGPILLLVVWNFRSLTIRVDAETIAWSFGSGWIRKQVAVAEVASVQRVKTSFMEGWGIHYTRYGWLYNVSGRDAVALTLQNGKRLAFGSDQAVQLAAALQAARSGCVFKA